MVYQTRAKKISQFPTDSEIDGTSLLRYLKNGVNKNIAWQDILNKISDVYGLSARFFLDQSQLVASDIALGEHAIVEGNGYSVYKITNLSAGTGDISLTSGLTATLINRWFNDINQFSDYNDAITNLPSLISAGLSLNNDAVTITDTNHGGQFTLINSVAHGITTTVGVQIRIDDDWYLQRVYSGPVVVDWFILDPTAANLAPELNLAYAVAATTGERSIAYSPKEYRTTEAHGRTSAAAGGTVESVYFNDAQITYTGTGTAIEYATDAPHLHGRLLVFRATVGASLYDDLTGAYASTIGISAPKIRGKMWDRIYIEGFRVGVDQNMDTDIDSSYRTSRCLFQMIDTSSCLTGWNAFCGGSSGSSFMTNCKFTAHRHTGANVKNPAAPTVDTATAWRGYNEGFVYDITNTTQANPCVVTTSSAHNFVTGDQVDILSIVGMTNLNGNTYTVTVINTTSFSLDGVDSTAFPAYVSGGTVRKNTSVTQYPRAIVWDSCVYEECLYCIRFNANGKGNNIIASYLEGSTNNVFADNTTHNPNMQFTVLGDQDESANILTNLDFVTQKHIQFTADRDIYIQSDTFSIINDIIRFGKTSTSKTIVGLSYDKSTGLIENVGSATAANFVTTATTGSIIEFYGGSQVLGEVRRLSNGIRVASQVDLELQCGASQNIVLNNLPTLDPGGSNRLWNNAGVINIT